MARIDRFMIAPLVSGQQTDLRPWLIPDDAFAQLYNAYVFRGRIIKRFGARLMIPDPANPPTPGYEQLVSRLRVGLGSTNGSGGFSGTVPGAIFEPGQLFSVGDAIFTCNATGTPAALLSTSSATGTYNTTSGALVISGADASTTVYFYPAQPVMGLTNYEQDNLAINPSFAFDTQFAYQYTSNGWARLGTAVWTGGNADFFWAYNWRGSTSSTTYLYVTNYHFGTTLNDSDPMYYWNGTAWTAFQPGFINGTATSTILTARIIVPFKDRLVLLSVVENTGAGPGTNAVYVNRCRYSWNGDPTNAAAFYENTASGVQGQGGYIDAPTKEAIITAQFLKDRLIVYFEKSTWELAYTGNQVLPFVWQQINTELGAESTFSQVPFDAVVLGVGNVGIHACNGFNVDRIDRKIPDNVFEIHNTDNGPQRVCGIRDYFSEMVYWAYPNSTQTSTSPFNNKVLVYNYKTGSWAINDDSITAFGNYQAASTTYQTWQETTYSWQEATDPWLYAPLAGQFNNIIAGNQEGFVFIIESGDGQTTNAQSLQITSIDNSNTVTNGQFTVYNHNLDVGYFVKIMNVQSSPALSPSLNGNIYKVDTIVDENTFTLVGVSQVTGTYIGGGTLTLVTPPSLLTKQYNFYVQEGRNASISKVDFLVLKTSDGEFTVDYYISSSNFSSIDQGIASGALVGTSVVETSPYVLIPQEQFQNRLWHPVYTWTDGECIQLRIYLTDDQATDPLIAESGFEIHAMTFYATRTSDRLQ